MELPIIVLHIKHVVNVLLELLFSNILETKCGLCRQKVL
jgi:hypothetical protein